MVGTFDRAWLCAQDFQLGALNNLMRPNARILLSVRESVAVDEVGQTRNDGAMDSLAALNALGLKPHIVGQALVPLKEEHSRRDIGEAKDSFVGEMARDSVALVGVTIMLRDSDYLVQLPGDKTNMNFRVSCYCCQ